MPDEPARKPAGAQVAIRADADAVARLDALAARLSYPGHPLTRADALRIVMVRGLDAFDQDLHGVQTHVVGSPLSPAAVAPPAPAPSPPEPRETLPVRGKVSPARAAKSTVLQGVGTRKGLPR